MISITNSSRPSVRPNVRIAVLPLLAPLAFAVLTACSGSSGVDEQLKADLAAASMAPSTRQQVISPQEMASGQGYGSAYLPGYGAYLPPQYPQGSQPQYGYPQAVASPQPQTRVVYVPPPASTVRRAGSSGNGPASGSGAGVYRGDSQRTEQPNTQKGAIIGAVAGTAIGVATSRDRVKGGAIGALGGAVLGGVIGHQIRTPRNP
jgi:hypothetical protein